jgi:hypothetical protein
MSLSRSKVLRIKSKISGVLAKYASVSPSQVRNLLPIKALQGKLYEAHVLADVCKNLVTREGLTLRFVNSGSLRLKQKGGPINRHYPFFEVYQKTKLIGELWTDVEFTGISCQLKKATSIVEADYHELDIVLLNPGCVNRPKNSEVQIGIECKNTSIKKSIIRELLGYRREMSFHLKPSATTFKKWPAKTVFSHPPSVYMLYCSDNRVSKYLENCKVFDIIIKHYKM